MVSWTAPSTASDVGSPAGDPPVPGTRHTPSSVALRLTPPTPSTTGPGAAPPPANSPGSQNPARPAADHARSPPRERGHPGPRTTAHLRGAQPGRQPKPPGGG